MTHSVEELIRDAKEIVVNVCEQCGTRYSKEEAQKMNMRCCNQPITQRKERVPVPLGP